MSRIGSNTVVVTTSKQKEDFESELGYHRREWLVQRIGWALMAAFLGAALLGFFGDGLVSDRQIGDPSVVTLQYERFARYASPARIEITIAPAAAAQGTVSFEVNEPYMHAFEVRSIVPEPRSVETTHDGVRFTFDARPATATIVFDLIPQKIGRQLAVFKVADRELTFRQFIYP
jgi:hypothetical protein